MCIRDRRLYSAAKRISRSKRRNDAACCSGGTGKPQRARRGAKANALPFSIFQCSPGRRSLAYLRTGNIGAGTVSPPDIQSPACNQLRKQGFFRVSYPGGKTVPAPIFPVFWFGPLGLSLIHICVLWGAAPSCFTGARAPRQGRG